MPARNGRLEQFGAGGCDAVPAERVEVGSKALRWVKAPFCKPAPVFRAADLGIEFVLSEHVEHLALSMVLDAGQASARRGDFAVAQ
jgi:hypothetical protein